LRVVYGFVIKAVSLIKNGQTKYFELDDSKMVMYRDDPERSTSPSSGRSIAFAPVEKYETNEESKSDVASPIALFSILNGLAMISIDLCTGRSR